MCNAAFIALIGALANRVRMPLRHLIGGAVWPDRRLRVRADLPAVRAIATVALMAAISGSAMRRTTSCMGVLPMGYAEKNITSSLVGIFDFSAYIGAGIAAFGLGLLISGSDVRPIAAVWLAAALIAALQGALLPMKKPRG